MGIEEKLEELDEQRQVLLKTNQNILPIFYLIPCIFIVAFLFQFSPSALLIKILLTALASIFYYYYRIGWPFQYLVAELKLALIQEYMKNYHPDIHYTYQEKKKDVRPIIKSTRIINASQYNEEDVLTGVHKGTHFYLSEIDLKRKSGRQTIRVFKGMMFRLSIPGKNFPHSHIQSKVGLLKKILTHFNKNEEFGFHYTTNNEAAFMAELEPLFPFIQHLVKQAGDLRIEVQGSEILILLESKEHFLDTPQPRLRQSFIDQDHYANVVKQLNSFLYIIEAFSSDPSPEQVEEQLELRVLEILKKKKESQ